MVPEDRGSWGMWYLRAWCLGVRSLRNVVVEGVMLLGIGSLRIMVFFLLFLLFAKILPLQVTGEAGGDVKTGLRVEIEIV